MALAQSKPVCALSEKNKLNKTQAVTHTLFIGSGLEVESGSIIKLESKKPP
jgi:hypothetical protein